MVGRRPAVRSADAVNAKPTRHCNRDALTAVPAADASRPDARDLDDASVLTVRVRLSLRGW